MTPDLIKTIPSTQPVMPLQGLPSPLTIGNCGSQTLAAAQAATLDHLTTIAGAHALTKAVNAQPPAHFWLISSLWHRKDRTPFFSRTLALPHRVESLCFSGRRQTAKKRERLGPASRPLFLSAGPNGLCLSDKPRPLYLVASLPSNHQLFRRLLGRLLRDWLQRRTFLGLARNDQRDDALDQLQYHALPEPSHHCDSCWQKPGAQRRIL